MSSRPSDNRRSPLFPWYVLACVFFALAPDLIAQKLKTNPVAPKNGRAQEETQQSPMGTHELSQSDLEAFLDGIMPQQLAREDLAGAVISVVKDGKVIFAKGYGYADVEKRIPVTADNTLFRPGSISKLFTWTAIMQLVEQGKLDLDRDVNDYLDFKIPANFSPANYAA